MDELMKAEVLVEHWNAYGDKELKKVGDSYSLPEQAFLGLESQGLLKKGRAEKETAARAGSSA